jgi:hypothetical protein
MEANGNHTATTLPLIPFRYWAGWFQNWPDCCGEERNLLHILETKANQSGCRNINYCLQNSATTIFLQDYGVLG